MLLSSVARLAGEEGGPDPSIRRRQRIRPERKDKPGRLLASSNRLDEPVWPALHLSSPRRAAWWTTG